MLRRKVGFAAMALTVAAFGLVACGGGGGGGPQTTVTTPPPVTTPTPPTTPVTPEPPTTPTTPITPPPPEPPPPPPPAPPPTPAGFTSWSTSLQPGATVVLNGQAIGATARDAAGGPGAATYTITLDADRYASAISVGGAGGAISFSTGGGDSLNRGSEYRPTSSSGDRRAMFSLPLGGWAHDYSSYGVWTTGFNIDASTVGAGSFGAVTPGGAIPTSGSANFIGRASAFYTDIGGNTGLLIGVSSLSADFGQRTGRWSTPLPGGMNLSSNMSWSPGENRMTGSVQYFSLTGAVNAWFYGPAATEVGGVFSLSPPAGSGSAERLIGAFGGQKLP